ncbi:hypothetical protein [Streptomyces sp. NPDC051636]|uniref:hypothetical protein n=1 Tax=Streptomyces sp. NPDC051636 TaxID=3365663 RepID=UPI00379B7E63
MYSGALTLKGITQWDPYDAVFKVLTAPHREGLYRAGQVKASEPALTDGDFTTYTDNKGVPPAGYTLDLGRSARPPLPPGEPRQEGGLGADQGLPGVRE